MAGGAQESPAGLGDLPLTLPPTLPAHENAGEGEEGSASSKMPREERSPTHRSTPKLGGGQGSACDVSGSLGGPTRTGLPMWGLTFRQGRGKGKGTEGLPGSTRTGPGTGLFGPRSAPPHDQGQGIRQHYLLY